MKKCQTITAYNRREQVADKDIGFYPLLTLTSTRLIERSRSGGGSVRLIDLKNLKGKGGLVFLRWNQPNWNEDHPAGIEIFVTPSLSRIGCCIFTGKDLKAIQGAVRAAK
jgi:hypothetical protein